MTDATRLPASIRRRLGRPILLTRVGMAAERAVRAFWPVWTILFATLAVLMLGLQDFMPLEAFWAGAALVVGGTAAALVRGARRFRWPRLPEVLDRLDSRLPGRPLAALSDQMATGTGDDGAQLIWRAHLRRMAKAAARARAETPDLRISARDPYALRYAALLAFVVALLFGSVWRVASVAELTPGGGQALAAGPVWEGWVEPPSYTGKPTVYLADIAADELRVAEGSRVTLRLYGEVGALAVTETVSGRPTPTEGTDETSRSFEVAQSGQLTIDGPGGRNWTVVAEPDGDPSVTITGEMERGRGGESRQPFQASDDYGVVAGTATITLDLDAVRRRHGLTIDPEPRAPVTVDLPMPISGDRAQFEEVLIENFSEHPWANLPVITVFEVADALGQTGQSTELRGNLGGLRFFDPMAQAIVEQRRDLLWNRGNARRVAQILRAVSYEPEDGLFPNETVYLRLRVAIRRLEAGLHTGPLTDARQEEVAQALWDIANEIEFGDLDDAKERLERAQDRLAEAMENGASDAEIAELMQEMREAMQEYLNQLAENAQPQDQQQAQGEMQEVTTDQLQEMMDRIQELMEQGRMDEAMELLQQLQQMMQNMQVVQGEGGQGQQGEGQQAMRDLNETLRGQQNLSDEAFRDLQDQFGQQQGQQQGQGQPQGEQMLPGQPGQQPGQQGQPGDQRQPGQNQGQNGQPGTADQQGNLADRQRALRQELDRQRGDLPGAGTEEGNAAREALRRADEAMDGAEQALRDENIPEALDRQADAMESLREGIRNLGEAIAQEQRQQNGQGQVAQDGQGGPDGQRRDPLGREAGAQGTLDTDKNLLQGEDVYRRAQDLMDEIQRRSGERDRPELERDYLKRLLDRF